MVGVNKVILIGNLGKNPEIVTFPQETHRFDGPNVVKKAIFPLATTEIIRSKDGIKTEQTEWHNVVCWRGLADVAERKLRKGTQIYVEGKLQSRSWEDKEGNKRYVTEVVAENFTVLGNRMRTDEQNAQPAQQGDPLDAIINDSTEPLKDLPF